MPHHRRLIPHPCREERGFSLIVVVFILIAVLAGGLAAVALTSGELSSTYGYRSRNVVQSCAQAALERIRAGMPALTVGDINDNPTQNTFPLPSGGSITLRVGHMNGDTGGLTSDQSPLIELPSTSFDVATLQSGENVTNAAGSTTGGTPRLYSVVATCTGPGNSQQEVQMIFKYTGPAPSP